MIASLPILILFSTIARCTDLLPVNCQNAISDLDRISQSFDADNLEISNKMLTKDSMVIEAAKKKYCESYAQLQKSLLAVAQDFFADGKCAKSSTPEIKNKISDIISKTSARNEYNGACLNQVAEALVPADFWNSKNCGDIAETVEKYESSLQEGFQRIRSIQDGTAYQVNVYNLQENRATTSAEKQKTIEEMRKSDQQELKRLVPGFCEAFDVILRGLPRNVKEFSRGGHCENLVSTERASKISKMVETLQQKYGNAFDCARYKKNI